MYRRNPVLHGKRYRKLSSKVRKAWLVRDDKYPDTSVSFRRPEVCDELEVEVAEDEARLIRRFQKLQVQYDALCEALRAKGKLAEKSRSGRA